VRHLSVLVGALILSGVAAEAPAQIGAGHWRPEDRVLVADFGFVTALARSADRMFAATSGGMLVNRDVFRRWELPLTREDGWPEVEITAMAYDRLDRALWLAALDGRLLSLDPDSYRWLDEVRLGRQVDMIVPVESGAGGLILRTAGGWLFLDTFSREVRPSSAAEANQAIERDPALRARRELLASPGFQSVQAFIGTGPDGRTWPVTDAIPTDDPARFWIATAGGGLSLLDSFSFDWRPIGIGLFGLGAAAVAVDGTDVWIASTEPILGRYGITGVSDDLETWEVIPARTAGGAPDRGIRALLVDEGTLWAAGEFGLRRRDRSGNWTSVAPGAYDRGEMLLTLAFGAPVIDGEPSLWIGGERGLDRVSPRGAGPERLMSGAIVTGILPFAGGVWAATSRGLVFVDTAGKVAPAADVPAVPAGAVVGDGKFVWAGVDRNVWQRDPESGWRRLDELGLLSAPVTALAAAHGILWVGTMEELVAWELEGGPVRRYTFAAGDLPLGVYGDRGVAGIAPVSPTRVWIATPAGALRLDSPF
jgi:ligand-binding sensor domain-containing protein